MRAPAFGDLCLALLREGHSVRFRAAGLSMAPSIEDGDVITVAPPTTAVRRGDVLLYLSGGRLTAHRVIGRVRGGEPLLRMRGDAPGWEEERVRLDAILGRVESVEREGLLVPARGPVARYAAGLARRLRRRVGRPR